MTTKISELPDAQSIGYANPATATGQYLIPSGSRAAPGLAFGNDPNTGITNGPGEGMEFVSNGAQIMRIQDGRMVMDAILFANGHKLWCASGFYMHATGDFTMTHDSGGNTAGGVGSVTTNRGASGTVTITLAPGADYGAFTNAGRVLRAMRVASQALRIKPHSGAAFMRASGTVEANDKYLELGSNGALLEVMWDGTNWLCLAERGTINVET